MEIPKVITQEIADEFAVYNADCTDMLKGFPENSVHYGIWSPPFASLYTFSDSPRDVSNNQDDQVFWDHYRYIMQGVYRVLKPGRMISIHCMDLPTSITRDGFIGMRDFPGENIRLAQEVGFIYHSRVFIRKDPVSAMQRTKAIGLLHKQVAKDSALSRMAIGDSIVTLRKPGDNPEPVKGLLDEYHGDDMSDDDFTKDVRKSWQEVPDEMGRARTLAEHKSIMIWQRYAESVWMDINQSDVLSHRMAREEHDERHISPLQITPVKRCTQLWTNPSDVVLSPFTGIGTAGYVALGMRRKFVGAELKSSYFRQAVANLKTAISEREAGQLFASSEMGEMA